METFVRSLDNASLQRFVACSLDLAGTLCGVAYAWLAVLSWESVEVDLGRFFLIICLAWGATLGVYFAQRDMCHRFPLIPMLVWGLLFRVLGVLGHPVLEDDYYRYLWDGRTFAVSGNPYTTSPSDYFTHPDVPEEFQKILDRINYPHIPTIYGPMCQYAFLVSYWMAPGQLLPLKLLLVIADIWTIWLLLKLANPVQVLLYTWCPLLIKETAFTAHPETLGVAFLVASLYLRKYAHDSIAAMFAALAVGTKLIAVLLVPFLLCRAGRKNWALFGLSLLVVYLPFWSQGSVGALHGTAAFLQGWEFNSSGYALLVAVFGGFTAKILGTVLFGAFYLSYLWRYRSNAHAAIPRGDWLYGVFFALSPVVNPWYLLWLLPFIALFPSCWGITALSAISLSYAHGLSLGDASLPPYGHPAWARPVEFGVIALAGLYDVWRSRGCYLEREGQ